MSKVVILLVYEDKIIRDILNEFYKALKEYDLQEGLHVYLLKIYQDIKRTDCNFFFLKRNNEITSSEHDKTIISCVVDTHFDFKSTRGLSFALNFIYSKHNDSLFFLIVHGHGQGMGFFIEEVSSIEPLSGTNNKNLKFEIKYDKNSRYGYFNKYRHNKQYDILWNNEFSKALYFVKGMYFEFALFSSCNTLLIDNCYLFSKKIKFLLATESYVAENFLDITSNLNSIVIYNNTSNDKVISIFDQYSISAQSMINDGLAIDPNVSFYLMPLNNFPLILLKLNEIVLKLLRKYLYNIEWIIELRNNIYSFDSSYDYIDLYSFLDALEKKFEGIDHFLIFKLKSLKEIIKKAPIKKWVNTGSNKIDEYNGIAIYFPKIDEEYYDRLSIVYYSTNNINYFLGRSNWDRFIRSINLSLYKFKKQKKPFSELITPI